MIRVEETTVDQINRALQALETLTRIGGQTTRAVSSVQVSSVSWFNIIAKPGTFPPSVHEHPLPEHTHPISDVIGLSETLDGISGGGGEVTAADFTDHQRLNIMGVY